MKEMAKWTRVDVVAEPLGGSVSPLSLTDSLISL